MFSVCAGALVSELVPAELPAPDNSQQAGRTARLATQWAGMNCSLSVDPVSAVVEESGLIAEVTRSK